MSDVTIQGQKVIRVSDEIHEQLKRMADQDHRTMGGQVAFLLEAELRRRAPLDPAQAAATQQTANVSH